MFFFMLFSGACAASEKAEEDEDDFDEEEEVAISSPTEEVDTIAFDLGPHRGAPSDTAKLAFSFGEPVPPEVPEVPVREADIIQDANRVGGSGDLKVTLLWDFQADIDLHVVQPSGREIYYQNKVDGASGGKLDVDNLTGGRGSAENIFWSNPPKGTYNVSLHYYQPSVSTQVEGSGTCHVVVFRKGQQTQTFDIPMSRKGQKVNVTSFTID